MAKKKDKKNKKLGKKVKSKRKTGTHSQFFLYLPSKGGKDWIEKVKSQAQGDKISPSRFIRSSVDPFLLYPKLRRKIRRAAKKQGTTPQKLMRVAVREYIANLGD